MVRVFVAVPKVISGPAEQAVSVEPAYITIDPPNITPVVEGEAASFPDAEGYGAQTGVA
jgi:hypothetical protein